MAKGQSRKGRTASKQAAKNVSYDQVLGVAGKIKSAIEKRSSKDLNALLGSSSIWLSNKPSDAKGLSDALNKLTGKASDVEFTLTKLENAEVSDNEVSIEAEAQLIWTNDDTWEEKETSFKLHLGLTKIQNNWIVKYLSVSPSLKNTGALTFETPAGGAYFDSMKMAVESTPYFSEEMRMPYFSATLAISPSNFFPASPYSRKPAVYLIFTGRWAIYGL